MRVEGVALPTCAECGECWLPADDSHWSAYLTDDEPPEVAFFCADALGASSAVNDPSPSCRGSCAMRQSTVLRHPSSQQGVLTWKTICLRVGANLRAARANAGSTSMLI